MQGHDWSVEPIVTVPQAREFFRAMGCSHFHMTREYPTRWNEYRQLAISEKMEIEWVKEQFDEYYASIMVNAEPTQLWMLHANMYDLLESLKTQAALTKMLEVTQFMRGKVPVKDRVIVAETINGRRYREFRSGLIYWAYDRGNVPAAKAFARLSLHFSTFNERENRGFERSWRASQLCNDIILELGL